MFPFLLRLKHDYAAVANGMHQCSLCVIADSLHGTVLWLLCTEKLTCIWAAVRFSVPALLTSTVVCMCVE
jgi:hypothetical protein